MECTYARIHPIVDGSGISFKVMFKNKVLEMFLVLVTRKLFSDSDSYEYIYMDKKKSLYTTGCYTGGNTRFGSNDIKPITAEFYKSYSIVSTDIKRINSLAKKEQIRAAKAKDNYNKRMDSLVLKINALPKKFKTGVQALDDTGFRFVRGNASYKPSWSSSIQGAGIYLENTKTDKTVYLDSYVSSDKKLLVNKFKNDGNWNFNDAYNEKWDSKYILSKLIDRRKELERTVNTIKQTA